jgi:hypothetical protein
MSSIDVVPGSGVIFSPSSPHLSFVKSQVLLPNFNFSEIIQHGFPDEWRLAHWDEVG